MSTKSATLTVTGAVPGPWTVGKQYEFYLNYYSDANCPNDGYGALTIVSATVNYENVEPSAVSFNDRYLSTVGSYACTPLNTTGSATLTWTPVYPGPVSIVVQFLDASATISGTVLPAQQSSTSTSATTQHTIDFKGLATNMVMVAIAGIVAGIVSTIVGTYIYERWVKHEKWQL